MARKTASRSRFAELVSRFVSDDRGSATVEFVIWVPWFCVLLIFTVDVTFMYMNLVRLENVARDAARRVAVGQYNKTEIVTFVRSRFPGYNGQDDFPFYASAECSTTDFACVRVGQWSNTMVVFGLSTALLNETFESAVRMRLEPGVTL